MTTLDDPKVTKARKEHQCNFCGDKILKGSEYIESTHVDDYLYHWKSHLHCTKLAIDLKMHKECNDDGVTQDFFMEYVSEVYKDIMRIKMTSLEFSTTSSIIKELSYVPFIKKLWFVIRHLKIN